MYKYLKELTKDSKDDLPSLQPRSVLDLLQPLAHLCVQTSCSTNYTNIMQECTNTRQTLFKYHTNII